MYKQKKNYKYIYLNHFFKGHIFVNQDDDNYWSWCFFAGWCCKVAHYGGVIFEVQPSSTNIPLTKKNWEW